MIAAFVGLTACAGQAPPKPETGNLYNQLGRMDGIDGIVDGFIFASIRNPVLKPSFKGMSLLDFPRLKYNFVQQMCDLAGGPCRYTGKNMVDSHKGLDITREQFNESGRLFEESMKKNGVGEKARQAMLAKLGALQKDIVGQ
ncbi:MAG: group 1 truncated hemoglobin [Proteobacteria bacterium]|nr:group 1 truncated hemoglobin [Pseudomonadota bacterium]